MTLTDHKDQLLAQQASLQAQLNDFDTKLQDQIAALTQQTQLNQAPISLTLKQVNIKLVFLDELIADEDSDTPTPEPDSAPEQPAAATQELPQG